MTGTGDFDGFARTVFGTDAPEFTSAEQVLRDGSQAVRCDYRIPLKNSNYELHAGGNSAVVDYRGSFWVDPSTRRVLELAVTTDRRPNNIPEGLDMFAVETLIGYGHVGAAGEELPYPANSRVTVSHLRSSIVTSNRIEFDRCREYSAQSRIDFGGRTPAVAVPGAARQLELPADLFLKMEGRILRLETDLDSHRTHVQLGFSHIESGGLTLPFRARFVMFTSCSLPKRRE